MPSLSENAPRARLLAFACAVLSACDPPLPSGNYEPEDVWAFADAEVAVRQEAGSAVPLLLRDASVTDGSGSVEEQNLRKLEGLYLMRMDMRSSSTVPVLAFRIQTETRQSHLLATRLLVVDGKLTADEKLCYQTFQHRCTNDCSSLDTTMHPEVSRYTAQLARSYKLVDDTLVADKMTMPLGFDGSKNSALPSSTGDERVWDLVPAKSPREGMMVTLELEGKGAVPSKTCSVYTVQRFTSSFEGKLVNGSLQGASFVLQKEEENKSLGSDDSQCSGGSGSSVVAGAATVRFAKTNMDAATLFDCPDAREWDVLPAPPP